MSGLPLLRGAFYRSHMKVNIHFRCGVLACFVPEMILDIRISTFNIPMRNT